MANVFQLFGQIFIDNAEANKSIDKTTEKAEKSGSKIGTAFASIMSGAAKLGTAVVGTATAVGAGALAMANSTASQADTIDKLSERTSINREELQRWMHACDQSGVSSDALANAVKKMSSTLDDAANGSTTALDSLSRLGISLEDLDGLSTEEKFDKITAALADMEDGTERNALGADLLGKAYTEMLPLLNAGSKGIKDLKKEADDLGIVMSEDTVKAGVVFGDTIENIKAAGNGFLNLIANALMPTAQACADWVINALPTVQGLFTRLAPTIQRVFERLLPSLLTLVEVLFPLLMSFIDAFLPVLENILPVILPILISLIELLVPIISELARIILPVLINLITALLPILELLAPILTPLLELVVKLLDPLLKLLNLILPPLINLLTSIIEKIIPALEMALSLIADLVAERFEDAFSTVERVFVNVKNIFSNIIDFVKNVFTGEWKSAWANVKNIFASYWDGLKTVVKAPINFIISGINTLIDGINKISFEVPDWVPGIGGGSLGFDIPNIPKLRRGLDYVPHDNYPALLHKGEQVLTASEKKERDKEKSEVINSKQEKKIEVKVDIHIDNFNNHSASDLEEFVEMIMQLIEEKIRQKGEVFS